MDVGWDGGEDIRLVSVVWNEGCSCRCGVVLKSVTLFEKSRRL